MSMGQTIDVVNGAAITRAFFLDNLSVAMCVSRMLESLHCHPNEDAPGGILDPAKV